MPACCCEIFEGTLGVLVPLCFVVLFDPGALLCLLWEPEGKGQKSWEPEPVCFSWIACPQKFGVLWSILCEFGRLVGRSAGKRSMGCSRRAQQNRGGFEVCGVEIRLCCGLAVWRFLFESALLVASGVSLHLVSKMELFTS